MEVQRQAEVVELASTVVDLESELRRQLEAVVELRNYLGKNVAAFTCDPDATLPESNKILSRVRAAVREFNALAGAAEPRKAHNGANLVDFLHRQLDSNGTAIIQAGAAVQTRRQKEYDEQRARERRAEQFATREQLEEMKKELRRQGFSELEIDQRVQPQRERLQQITHPLYGTKGQRSVPKVRETARVHDLGNGLKATERYVTTGG